MNPIQIFNDFLIENNCKKEYLQAYELQSHPDSTLTKFFIMNRPLDWLTLAFKWCDTTKLGFKSFDFWAELDDKWYEVCSKEFQSQPLWEK